MFMILSGIGAILGIGSLICWIMVVIAAFKNESSPLLGILSIVLCGLGAFIIGWIKNGQWGIKNLMMIWSAVIVGSIIFQILAAMFAPAVAV